MKNLETKIIKKLRENTLLRIQFNTLDKMTIHIDKEKTPSLLVNAFEPESEWFEFPLWSGQWFPLMRGAKVVKRKHRLCSDAVKIKALVRKKLGTDKTNVIDFSFGLGNTEDMFRNESTDDNN